MKESTKTTKDAKGKKKKDSKGKNKASLKAEDKSDAKGKKKKKEKKKEEPPKKAHSTAHIPERTPKTSTTKVPHAKKPREVPSIAADEPQKEHPEDVAGKSAVAQDEPYKEQEGEGATGRSAEGATQGDDRGVLPGEKAEAQQETGGLEENVPPDEHRDNLQEGAGNVEDGAQECASQEQSDAKDECSEGGDIAVEESLAGAHYSADLNDTEDDTSEEENAPDAAYDQTEGDAVSVAGSELASTQWQTGDYTKEATEAQKDGAEYSGETGDYTDETENELCSEDGTGGTHPQQSPENSVIYLGAPATATPEEDVGAQERSSSAQQQDKTAATQEADTLESFGAGEGARQDAPEDSTSGKDDDLATEEARVAQAIASVFSAANQESDAQANGSAEDAAAGASGEDVPSAYSSLVIAAQGQPQLADGGTTAGDEGTRAFEVPADDAGDSSSRTTVIAGDEEGGESSTTQQAASVDTAESGKKNVLRVSSLYKSFGRKTVVKGVEFSMTTGEVLGLLGPNGAGKTTTFYMIVGFYKPTSGDVFLDEKCITHLPMYKRARAGISYLPQEPSVFRKLTVEENIWAILETRKDLTRAEKKRKLNELIDEFAIGRIRKQQAYTLSGGERRRTEIARSLAIEPKFLLLDEPFAGIDPIAVADIKSMIRLLSKRGIGILITDHNVRDTLEITDRAIIISTGTILVSGGKEDILRSDEAREIYLGKDFSM